MTTEQKKEWLDKNVCADAFDGKEMVEFYYATIHDNDMSLYDADRYAWLNTLFGYDIGIDNSLQIMRRYHEYNVDVMELDADDMWPIMYEIGWELGLTVNKFVDETPKAIKYY